MHRSVPVRALAVAALLMVPRFTFAQAGALVHAGVGAASSDGHVATAFNGGVTYRFNRALGIGVELTHIPDFESDPFDGVIILANGDDDEEANGQATTFTTNVRLEIPTSLKRVLPYAVGGGGVASVTEAFPVYYAIQAIASLPVRPTIYPGPRVIESTSIAMTLTLGGGASFLVTDHFAVDVDLRALKLIGAMNNGDTGRTLGRFGVGASYRF